MNQVLQLIREFQRYLGTFNREDIISNTSEALKRRKVKTSAQITLEMQTLKSVATCYTTEKMFTCTENIFDVCKLHPEEIHEALVKLCDGVSIET